MARYIIKLDDYYMEWSSIVDAPVTFGLTLEEFSNYYHDEYGNRGMCDLDDRLKRVEKFGTSSYDKQPPESIIYFNRAGPNEDSISREEIIKAYCKREPIRDGWMVP